MKAADDGNVKVVENYLKNGGSTNLSCWVNRSGDKVNFPGGRTLSTAIAVSGNYDLIKMYLKYNVSSSNKQKLLSWNVLPDSLRNDEIVNLLVENNIYYNLPSCSLQDTSRFLLLIEKFGYDINNINNDLGTNAVVSFTNRCSFANKPDDMIQFLKFLIKHGANPKHIDKEGSTIFTNVTNPEVIEFLKTL